MTYGHKQILTQIYELGKIAAVEVQSTTGSNEFGNTDTELVPDRTVIAFRTHPNRNTSVENNVGDLDQDRPVFLVPKDDDNIPPEPNDAIVYDGTKYEAKSHTEYETHVEFFGEPIIH